MPYGQIITLMVALVLITGAPSNHTLAFPLSQGLFLWTAKTVLWWFTVRILVNRSPISRLHTLSEKLETLALIPLLVDFYLLDVKDMLGIIPWFKKFNMLEEFAGLGLYFLYLAVVWLVTAQVTERRTAHEQGMSRAVRERFNMILPALVPYLLLSIGFELAAHFAPPWLRSIFNSSFSPLLTLAIFSVILAFLVPPILKKIWRCIPMPDSALKRDLLDFIRKTGISFNEIYIWPLGEGRACTAAVVGIIPGFRYIFITPCLLKYLKTEEIEAVLSHETEHVRQHHILWYVFFLAAYSIIMYRLMDPAWSWLTSREFFVSLLIKLEDSPEQLAALAAALPMMAMIVLYFRYLMGWFMRNFERQADMSVFRTQGHPWHMIAALEKVALFSGGTRDKPSWHHFSIAERVEFLYQAAQVPELLNRHEKRLRKAKTTFISLALALFMLPGLLPVKSWKRSADINLARLYINQISSHGERNADWYLMLGQVLSERKQYARAVQAYLKALEVEPDNPLALNNLAWLYATSEDKAFRKPQEALMLAIKAASIKPDSYILDTLAECFFVNGYIEKAIETEKEAILKASHNRDYYMKQLQKFQTALMKQHSARQE